MDDIVKVVGNDQLTVDEIQAKLIGQLAPGTIRRNLYDAYHTGRIGRERGDTNGGEAPFIYFLYDET